MGLGGGSVLGDLVPPLDSYLSAALFLFLRPNYQAVPGNMATVRVWSQTPTDSDFILS